jgi:hypothetical protein
MVRRSLYEQLERSGGTGGIEFQTKERAFQLLRRKRQSAKLVVAKPLRRTG